VLAVLAATAVAFVTTQRKKLEPTAIAGTEIGGVLSPVCGCPLRRVAISFRLREPDTATVVVVDRAERRVRTLLPRRRVAGDVQLAWNGRDEGGSIAADGDYHVRVRLERDGRTFLLPNVIRLDTTPPRVTLADVRPKVLQRGRGRRVLAFYSLSETARPLLFVDGRLVARGRLRAKPGALEWFPGSAPPRTYRLTLRARDEAENLGPRSRAVSVTLR